MSSEGLVSHFPASERYKACKQIRQQQVEKYYKFIKEEEQQQKASAQVNKGKKEKKHKEKEKKKKKNRKDKKAQGVHFSKELCLQSHVEELDEKHVIEAWKAGSNFNFTTGNGTSLLHKACTEGSAPLVELLLLGGANVNQQDDDLWTPLHAACYQDHSDVVQMLLKSGADVTLLDIDGNFPLDHCVQNTDSWTMVIQHMEQLGLTSEKMKKIRNDICKQMETDVKSSLTLGVDLDRPLYDGVTLLHIASANGFLRVVRYLLRKGAKLDVKDDAGFTPLHCAAKFGQVKTTKLLLDHGADPAALYYSGNRVIEVTSSEEIQQLLLTTRAKKRHSSESGLQNEAEGGKKEVKEEENLDDPYDKPEDGFGSITRHLVYSPRASMSKADKLSEARVLLSTNISTSEDGPSTSHELQDASETTRKGVDNISGKNGHEEEEDDNDDNRNSYYFIWQAESLESFIPETIATDDLSNLPNIDESTVLKTVVSRYSTKRIYTNIGDILIAVNPFEGLPIYGRKVSIAYHTQIWKDSPPTSSLPPHIYAVAERALKMAISTGLPQCCVIGGQSGAGKTESCKHLLQHLLWSAGSPEGDLITKLTQVNPLLEAFGNASTVINPNSSRFAKFVSLNFSTTGKVLGGQLSEYLLEKSRVVNQGPGEKNFHIFYWMLAGVTPEEANVLDLQNHHFRYLKCENVDLNQTTNQEDKAKFWAVKESLKFIGFSGEDVTCVLMILSAILHLGNLVFLPCKKNEDHAAIKSLEVVNTVASLLHVSAEDLQSSLLEDVLVARGEQTKKPLSTRQAYENTDSLAKSLYSRLFSWIVNGLNQMVQSPPQETSLSGNAAPSIGVLDLFGFENLSQNGFEQMCINVANERLQSFYNNLVFENEMRDCVSEGVSYVDISLPGNQEAISLFMAKNTGIFDILDEESKFPKATDESLASKLHSVAGKSHPSVFLSSRYGGTSFTVVHYAGNIAYDVTGLLNTNRDNLRPAMSFVMRGSTSLVVKEMFQSRLTATGSISPSQRQRVSRHMKGAKSPFDFFKKLKMSKKDNQKKNDHGRAVVLKRVGNTLASYFKNSLNDLLTRVQSGSCHSVRCLKPNQSQKAFYIEENFLQAQLYYTGVFQTVTMRKQGYALRTTFSHFTKLYPILTCLTMKGKNPILNNPIQATKEVFEKHDIRNYQVGKTKVFLKQTEVQNLDKLESQMLEKIVKAQAVVRRFLAQAKVDKLRAKQKQYKNQLDSFGQTVEAKQTTMASQLGALSEIDIEASIHREEAEYLELLDSVLEEYSEAQTSGFHPPSRLGHETKETAKADEQNQTERTKQQEVKDNTVNSYFDVVRRPPPPLPPTSLPPPPTSPPPPRPAPSKTPATSPKKPLTAVPSVPHSPPPPTSPPPPRPLLSKTTSATSPKKPLTTVPSVPHSPPPPTSPPPPRPVPPETTPATSSKKPLTTVPSVPHSPPPPTSPPPPRPLLSKTTAASCPKKPLTTVPSTSLPPPPTSPPPRRPLPSQSSATVSKEQITAVPSLSTLPPPPPLPLTTSATDAKAPLTDSLSLPLLPPPSSSTTTTEYTEKAAASESGTTDQYKYDRSDPTDVDTSTIRKEMDSNQYPPPPREMYMYMAPAQPSNGLAHHHHHHQTPGSPSGNTRSGPPPSLPERRPDTQLGNRKSTASAGSRGSSSSDVFSDQTPPGSPSVVYPQNNQAMQLHYQQYQQHQHHTHHEQQHHHQQQHAHHEQQHLHQQHHPHHDQQQQHHQNLTAQIEQQLRQQQLHQQQNPTKKFAENRPFSYAIGLNPKEAAHHLHHHATEQEIRPKAHPQRDASPSNGRAQVKSDGHQLPNGGDYQTYIQNDELNEAIFKKLNGSERSRAMSTPDALRRSDSLTERQGQGQPAQNASEGIYGKFVHPGSQHRPSLTYVPPPMVPQVKSQEEVHYNQGQGSPIPTSAGTSNGNYPISPMMNHQQHQYQIQQQQYYQPSPQSNGQHHQHHHQHASATTAQSNAGLASPKLPNRNKTRQDGIPPPPSFPAPLPPVQLHDKYMAGRDRSPSPPPPPPPQDSFSQRTSSFKRYAPKSAHAQPQPASSHPQVIQNYQYDQQNPTQYGYNQTHVMNYQESPYPSYQAPLPPNQATPLLDQSQPQKLEKKQPPLHTPPPPPSQAPPPPPPSQVPPLPPMSSSVQPMRQTVSGVSQTHSSIAANPPHHPLSIQQQRKQSAAATLDELAQVKLRNVAEACNSQPSKPAEEETSVTPINVKLRPTPGKFAKIYQEEPQHEEVNLPPPPPPDDLDELPPPPPPPELLEQHHHHHHQPPLSAQGGAVDFTCRSTNLDLAHNQPHSATHPTAHLPAPVPHSSTPAPSHLPTPSASSHTAYPSASNPNLPAPAPHSSSQSAGERQQHAHSSYVHQQSTVVVEPPPPPPSPPLPAPSSTSQSYYNPRHQQQHHHQQQHTSNSSSGTERDSNNSTSKNTGDLQGTTSSGLTGLDKVIFDAVSNMDFEIPDDIDLSQCPGLVEITKATPNWKKEMIEKKNQEKIEEYVKKILKEREKEAKWKNVPEWKRKLLEKKDQEDEAAAAAAKNNSTPPTTTPSKTPSKKPVPAAPVDDFTPPKPKGDIVPAALSIDPEELAAMPPWKRELLFKRDKVPITFSNEFNPDEDEPEPPQCVPVMADPNAS